MEGGSISGAQERDLMTKILPWEGGVERGLAEFHTWKAALLSGPQALVHLSNQSLH